MNAGNIPIGFTACWKPWPTGRCRMPKGHDGDCAPVGFAEERKGHEVLLFIDFDGVLHPYPFHWGWGPMFHGVAKLKEILADFSEVGVVVHSSWRCEYRLGGSDDDLDEYLQLGPTLLGATNRLIQSRWESIRDWLLSDHRPHVILDDFGGSFPTEAKENLICTQGIVGMTDADWAELRRRLEAFRAERR